MDISEKLRLESSIVRLFIVTLLGIAFELILALPTLSLVPTLIGLPGQQALAYSALDILNFIGAYLLVPVVYCIIVSYWFEPKRIVSPLNIQLGTVAIGTIMVVDRVLFQAYYYTPFPQPQGATIAVTLLYWFTAAFVSAVVIGAYQTRMVRWWVGLNLEDYDRVTYVINDDFDSLADAFDDEFLKTFGLQKRREKEILIITSKYLTGDSIIMVMMRDGDPATHKLRTILATVAFKTRVYTLSRSKQASAERDTVVWALKGKMQDRNYLIAIVPKEGLDDFASDLASRTAENLAQEPTISKATITLQFYRDMQRFHKVSFLLTVVVLPVVFGIAWYYYHLGIDSYLSLLGTLAFFGFLMIGDSLRQERKLKKLGEIQTDEKRPELEKEN
jgi:hypothetical protein